MSDATLTLQEAADDLGVHYMTAYRYVRLGLLPAQKLGGVWRVDRADLEQFRSGNGNAPVRGGRPAPWAERLEARLLAGDARGAWGVVEAALAAGSELDEIYLDVLTPAMVSIGNRWSAGEIDIGLEHRATGIAMRLVGRLGPRFVRRGRSRGAVVLATPAGEKHALSVAVLADLLRLEGWEVSDLGADTPAESLGLAAAHPEVVAVGISVTHPQHHDACRESCAAVRRHAPGVLIVAGGQGVDSRETAIALGAHEHAASAKEMVRVLDRLPGTLDLESAGDAAAGA
ncbi:MAG: cobalamin-dependent protein [Ilumatobacteraceae bacterium]|nr:cobalamin-dependent protein [Ilumatobacteraceae bacterium]